MPSSMPPRRRPGQPAQPARRPRVAGLRHPGKEEADRQQQVTDPSAAERTEVLPVIPAEPGPTVEPEPERPRPAGKRRPRPTPKPAAEPAPAPVPDPVAEPVAERMSARSPSLALRIGLLAVIVVFGGAAVAFGVLWSHARGASNTALVDGPTTAEVAGQVQSAVNTVFSYDYTKLAKTEQAVPKLLTGTALCQYKELFKQVQAQAPGQKLVLTTTVQNKGVELIQGDRARVLLRLDQHDTRAQTNQTTDSQAVIAVNAVRQGGEWKISSIDTFNGANPTSCQA